jgi:hypothetical protein
MLLPQNTSITILRDSKLKETIEAASVLAPLQDIYDSGKYKVVGIRGSNPHYKNIRTFVTPVIINKGEPTIVIDIRTGVKGSSENPTLEQMPVLQTRYAILIGEWMTGGDNRIINSSDAILKAYSYWLSGQIARQYGLGSDERNLIGILACAFYLSKRAIDVKFDDTLRAMCLRRISRIYGAGEVSQVLSHVPERFCSIEDFTSCVKSIIGNNKLEDLHHVTLMKFTAINVAGLLESDVIFATALEYPPAFIALVLLILSNTFLQKSSPLGIVVRDMLTTRDRNEIEKEFKFF